MFVFMFFTFRQGVYKILRFNDHILMLFLQKADTFHIVSF